MVCGRILRLPRDMANILVCDDEGATVGTLQKAFSGRRHSVTVVSDVVDAVRVVYPGKFQTLFIGIDLRKANETKSRVAALRVLRRIDPDLPIVVLARGNSLELEREVRLEGIFCFCLKPINTGEAIDILANALKLRPSPHRG